MRVLFVCTGNIFRSMSAEYLMKKYLDDNRIEGFEVSSCGTIASPEPPYQWTVERLSKYGVSPNGHVQRKITKDIAENADVIVAMAEHHKIYIEEKFGLKSHLFKEISEGKCEDLADDNESHRLICGEITLKELIFETVDYIYDVMPDFVERIKQVL
ncbi:MAG: hypothetical protein ACOCXG_05120 [Nanoarchaeota archaeon]